MARRTSPLSLPLSARRTLVALAMAGIALGAGAATASAADGGGVSGLTGPVTQTGSVGAVPTLERLAEGLLGGGED
jgi:hypothetical protein